MTAFQDAQATEWRDVAIGEIPEVIIYRDETRHIYSLGDDCTFGLAVIIMLLVRGTDGCCCSLLWCGGVYAYHGHGAGHPATCTAKLDWTGSYLGFACRAFCCHPGGFCGYSRLLGSGKKVAGCG